MALTWAAIVARALNKLDAVTAANHWDKTAGNPNLVALAKEIEREFIYRTDYFVQTSSQSIVSGTASYSKPTGCLKIHGVYVGSDPITQQNNAEIYDYYGEAWTAKTGTPIMYMQMGGTILLVPIPDENSTDGLVIINTYLPTQGDTNSSVDEQYLEVLSDGVAGKAYYQDPSNINMAPLYYNDDPNSPGRFQKGITEAKKQLRSKDRIRQFRFNTPYNVNAYMNNY